MSKHLMNDTLFDIAEWRLRGEGEKQAFVPQGATDPAAAAGMPPGDPMAAGMPPGMPPGDPMAAAGGAMPGGAPPMDPMAAQGAGMMPPAAPAPAQGQGQGGTGGKPKIDPTFIYMELARVRKLLTHFIQQSGMEMPPDILDDGAVAMVAQGQMPQSAPLGQGGQAEQGAGLPAVGGAGAINPLEPAGGSEKPAHDIMSLFRGPADANASPDFESSQQRIDALSCLSRSLNGTKK